MEPARSFGSRFLFYNLRIAFLIMGAKDDRQVHLFLLVLGLPWHLLTSSMSSKTARRHAWIGTRFAK